MGFCAPQFVPELPDEPNRLRYSHMRWRRCHDEDSSKLLAANDAGLLFRADDYYNFATLENFARPVKNNAASAPGKLGTF